MAHLPKVQDADFVEREGIIHVDRVVNKARCIWREVVHRDIGIDGHIEYVTPQGDAPGRLIAVQVKSGESRFAHANEHHVPFYPEEKHRRYWAEHPLPVVLVLHNPVDGETVWADARESLRVRADERAILVSRSQVFDTSGVLQALAVGGPLPAGPTDLHELLVEMANPHPSAQGLCFLYLFAQGMTDIANSVYFSMDVVHEVLEIRAAELDPPSLSIGPAEFAFVDAYVEFLVRHDLARVDFGSWRQTALEREMTGNFIAPLTARGRAVRDAVVAVDESIERDEVNLREHSVAIRERFVQMLYDPPEAWARQKRIERVQAAITTA